MNTVELAKAYAVGGSGLIFRLRLQSPNQALGHRLEHGRGPRVREIAAERPAVLPRIRQV